jgi:hypothetical protein
MTNKTLVLCLIIAFILGLFSTPTRAQFDLSTLDDAFSSTTNGTSRFITQLKMSQSNPTFGSVSRITFDFLTRFHLGLTNSFVVNIPGYTPTDSLRARLVRTKRSTGEAIQYSRWKSFNEITGTKFGLPSPSVPLNNLLNPGQTQANQFVNGLRFILPNEWSLITGSTMRIELEGVEAPERFSDWSSACQSAFAASTPSSLSITDALCCGQFAIGVLTGGTIGDMSAGVFDTPVKASACPNYGSTAEDFAPPACATTQGVWSQDMKDLCCQYDTTNNENCHEYRCQTNWSAETCCDVKPPSTMPSKNSQCPICSNANWDVGVCCDRYDTANPQYLWNYQNDSRCDAVFCACEDWSTERCCFKYSKNNPFYEQNGLKCPTCTDPANPEDWSSNICCRLSAYWGRPECACRTENGGVNYNIDICCQDVLTASPLYCPRVIPPVVVVPPEENEIPDEEEGCSDCACNMDDCQGPQDDDCLDCFNSIVDNNTDPNHAIHTHYFSQELHAHDIKSGHNTILINNLHVDTIVHFPDGSYQTLQSMVPNLHVTVGSNDNTCGIGLLEELMASPNKLSQGVTNALESTWNDLNTLTTNVGSNLIKSTTKTQKDTQDSVVNVINQTLGNINNTTDPTLGLAVRQAAEMGGLQEPFPSAKLVNFSTFVTNWFKNELGVSNNNLVLKVVSQLPFGDIKVNNNGETIIPGYSIIYEIAVAGQSQDGLATKVNAARTRLSDALTTQYSISTRAAEVIKVSEASPETLQSQAASHYPCTENADCLSGYCSTDDSICLDNPESNNGNSAMKVQCGYVGFLMVGVILAWVGV